MSAARLPELGSVVWAEFEDDRGYRKLRPAVVVTPTAKIVPGSFIRFVAVTSSDTAFADRPRTAAVGPARKFKIWFEAQVRGSRKLAVGHSRGKRNASGRCVATGDDE